MDNEREIQTEMEFCTSEEESQAWGQMASQIMGDKTNTFLITVSGIAAVMGVSNGYVRGLRRRNQNLFSEGFHFFRTKYRNSPRIPSGSCIGRKDGPEASKGRFLVFTREGVLRLLVVLKNFHTMVIGEPELRLRKFLDKADEIYGGGPRLTPVNTAGEAMPAAQMPPRLSGGRSEDSGTTEERHHLNHRYLQLRDLYEEWGQIPPGLSVQDMQIWMKGMRAAEKLKEGREVRKSTPLAQEEVNRLTEASRKLEAKLSKLEEKLNDRESEIEFIQEFLRSERLWGVREASKAFGISQSTFIRMLEERGIAYREGEKSKSDRLPPLQPSHPWSDPKYGYFKISSGIVRKGEKNEREFKQLKFTHKGLIWVAKTLGLRSARPTDDTGGLEDERQEI